MQQHQTTAQKQNEAYKMGSKELQKNFQHYIEYIVEFTHLMPANMSTVALGGQSAKEHDWTLELEPFSTFSYSVMRNNIFSLCVVEEFQKMRDSIIYLQAPKNPSIQSINDLHKRFRHEL